MFSTEDSDYWFLSCSHTCPAIHNVCWMHRSKFMLHTMYNSSIGLVSVCNDCIVHSICAITYVAAIMLLLPPITPPHPLATESQIYIYMLFGGRGGPKGSHITCGMHANNLSTLFTYFTNFTKAMFS